MRFRILFLFTGLLVVSVCSGQPDATGHRMQKVFTEAINDSTNVDVFLRYDQKGEPEHYLSPVNTAVCEDGLCRLMIINVYWDLLGNFLKYDFPPGEALTKLDHQEFSREDHEQLYKILSDRSSILKDYPPGDLVDRRIKSSKEKADAVSSATRVDVKDAVVSGAVFSTYVLWHIVNGEIASRILEHSKSLLTPERVKGMFYSANFYYQYYALNTISRADSLKYIDEIIHLVKNGSSYIPYFAIEKVPASAWTTASHQSSLAGAFASAEFELQNAMLSRLEKVSVSSAALNFLVAGMDGLRESQLLKVLAIISRNESRLSETARAKLEKWQSHPNKEVARNAKAILKTEGRKG